VLGLDFFPPKPAVKEVPEWYKHTPEYVGEQGKKIIDPNNQHIQLKNVYLYLML
jgi:hypothetical protein